MFHFKWTPPSRSQLRAGFPFQLQHIQAGHPPDVPPTKRARLRIPSRGRG